MSTKSRRIEHAEKPQRCPECGKAPVATILYGMPAFSRKLERDIAHPICSSTFFPATERFSLMYVSSHRLEITAVIFWFCKAHK